MVGLNHHNTELWRVVVGPDGKILAICDDKFPIALLSECRKEEAERIVACVNAFRGIPTEIVRKIIINV